MATLHFLSHQVDILYDSAPNPICAGTLISPYLVLTVFSCLAGKNETKLKVRPSARNADGIFQTRNVSTIHTFPAFKSEPLENDIAVLLLDSDFQLGKSLKVVDILQHNADEPDDFFALSQSSLLSTCASFAVEKTKKSDCRTENPNPSSICVQPSQKSSCPLPLPVPLMGSGLICQLHGLNFLCGALANIGSGNGKNAREYTDISKYRHWIQLALDTSGRNGNSSDDHELEATMFKGREVSATGVSSLIPYQLSLQAQFRGTWNHLCGAIIIDEKTALTAAHCFDDRKYKRADYRVVAGVTHLNSTSTKKQILPLKRIIRHSEYNIGNVFKGNDIAVVHVEGSFVYTENVGNIWISTPQELNTTDLTGRMSGWGKTSETEGPSNSLQAAEMRILSDSECKKMWSFLKPSMICAYDNVSNTCRGDSGGPLAIQNYRFNQNTTRDLLLGIGSFSPKNCEQEEMPNAFAKVSHFLDWIREKRGLKCGATEFQCYNGQCIDECSLCNGIDECGDGSDEGEKQCPMEKEIDLRKIVLCTQKEQKSVKEELKALNYSQIHKIQELQEKVESGKENFKALNYSQIHKIQELEEKVESLNRTILQILRQQTITLKPPNPPADRPLFFNLTAKMRIPNPRDPTETELKVCVNSLQTSGFRDSIASIELPSGYIFYEEDYEQDSDFMKSRPRNVQRFELSERNTKMDVYYSKIKGHPPTCLTFVASQQFEVANPKNSSVLVYEYLDPSRKAQIMYEPAHAITG